jgi:hypothetical protein
LVKKVYVTVPVATIVPEVVTVAVSYAEAPVVSVPAHAALVAASKTTVLVVDELFRAVATVRVSPTAPHVVATGLLLASPL